MKKLIIASLYLSLWIAGNLFAQEFSLPVSIYVDSNAVIPNRTVVFGYDPTALDALEGQKWFPEYGGEQGLAPASGDFDFRLSGEFINRSSDLPDGSYVDIRKKPDTISFTLQYEIDMLVSLATNAKIKWNSASIPSIIQHITLSSALTPNKIRLDMKTTDSLVFPIRDSISYYRSMILTLYYNRDLQNAVSESSSHRSGFSVYPNPIDSYSKLHFYLNEGSHIELSIFDVIGKKVFDKTVDALAGENTIELSKNEFSSHPGIYLLRFSGLEKGSSFVKTQTLIVR
jgi:hypothetical protein